MEELKWLARPIMAVVALIIWTLVYYGTGEPPPAFLDGIVTGVWAAVIVSREREKTRDAKIAAAKIRG